MDNLTHSLVGALLGQMGLKRKTGLAMPTLIIAANLPDIDAVATLLGGHQHLAIRRGITHGPIAMFLLPLMLWGAMLWFDAWQTRRGKRPEKRLPVHKGWLLALAFIACLSHPLFDWFNSYGVRLLEPFSSQWFYGDTLFIIDVWIWVVVGVGLCVSMRRERQANNNWKAPAFVAGVFLVGYIAANTAISSYFVSQLVAEQRLKTAMGIIANPVPIAFWKREMLWQLGGVGSGFPNTYRSERSLFQIAGYTQTDIISDGPNDIPSIAAQAVMDRPLEELQQELRARSVDLDVFHFWSRMPYARYEASDRNCETNCGTFAVFRDARFSNPLVSDRFTVKVKLEGREGYQKHRFRGSEPK